MTRNAACPCLQCLIIRQFSAGRCVHLYVETGVLVAMTKANSVANVDAGDMNDTDRMWRDSEDNVNGTIGGR